MQDYKEVRGGGGGGGGRGWGGLGKEERERMEGKAYEDELLALKLRGV